MSYQPVLHGALPQIRPLCRPAAASGRRARRCRRSPAGRRRARRASRRSACCRPAACSGSRACAKTWLKPPPETIQPTSACVRERLAVAPAGRRCRPSACCVCRRVGAQVRAADAGHERVGRRPLDRRVRDRSCRPCRPACFVSLAGAAVAGRAEHGDAVGRGRLERVAQVQQRLRAAERVLGRAEALRDDVRRGGGRRRTARRSSSAGSPARRASRPSACGRAGCSPPARSRAPSRRRARPRAPTRSCPPGRCRCSWTAAPWSPASPAGDSSLNVGMPGVQVTPSSPHIGGSPNAWSKTCRSWAIVSLP